MSDFEKQWNTEMAMSIMANKTVDSETWAEAVEWLMLYGPPHIQEILNQASHVATSEHFPELKPSGYNPDGTPLYDVQALAKALNISAEDILEKLHKKEEEQETRHLFAEEDSLKIH
ncbi:MAG: hypothetical protein KKD73_14290 [Proteobacteria bacterium]|nr:hypothetical protein [Pseudomonadota bacterium]MBU1640012.1 hypothetical protein [Pseudomonadota bacterium]